MNIMKIPWKQAWILVWALVALGIAGSVASAETNASPEFLSLCMDKTIFSRDEEMRGTVMCRPVEGRITEILVRLWDDYDRLIAITQPNDQGRFQFDAVIVPVSKQYRVEALLIELPREPRRSSTVRPRPVRSRTLPALTVDESTGGQRNKIRGPSPWFLVSVALHPPGLLDACVTRVSLADNGVDNDFQFMMAFVVPDARITKLLKALKDAPTSNGGSWIGTAPELREPWVLASDNLEDSNAVLVSGPGGIPRLDVKSYVFDNGPSFYLALIPDRSGSEPWGPDLTVNLAHPYYVYDIPNKKCLGRHRRLSLALKRDETVVLACLPDSIEGVSAQMSRLIHRRGDVAVLRMKVLCAQSLSMAWAVHLEVYKDKQSLPYWDRIVVGTGTIVGSLPIALNMETGEYVVTVTDYVSGLSDKTHIVVE